MRLREFYSRQVWRLGIAGIFLLSGCLRHPDLMAQGQQALEHGNYDGAVNLFSKAVASAPTGDLLEDSLRFLSKAYKAEGKDDQAAATLVRAMRVMRFCIEDRATAQGRRYCPIPPWERS